MANQEYKMIISKEEIYNIYHNEYIKGVSALKLENKYSLRKGYLYRWFNKLNLPLRSNSVNSKKYTYDENYFENIDTEGKAYWLGFIYADGYITSKQKYSNRSLGIALSIKDKKHLEKFNTCLNSNVRIKTYTEVNGYAKGSRYCRVIYTGLKITNDLIKHGVYENKTDILKEPINIPYDLIRHFIRGYFDGDGSAWKQDKYTQINISIVGTDNLLNFIMNYLSDNKVILRKYPLNKRMKNHIVSNFKFGGNYNAFRFLDFIYGDSSIYLQRKYNIYLELKEYIDSHPIQ